MDEEQREQSPKGPDLISLGQNIYQGRGLAQKGAQIAARALPLLANPVTVSIIAVVVVVLLVFVFSNQGATGEPPSQTPASSQNINGLITITGASETQTKITTEALNLALSYPLYRKLLTSGGVVNVSFVETLPDLYEGADAVVLKGDEIKIRSGLPSEKLKWFFLHETGHIIIFRNAAVFSSYKTTYPDLIRDDGSLCYSPFLKLISYPYASTGGGGDADVESFAESVAQFLIYKEVGKFRDFPNDCPKTYNWFLENVFLGKTTQDLRL